MRIWDIAPGILCRKHLLGEHRELHAIWIILTQDKKGYRNHPETKRWVSKLKALHVRHELLAKEMEIRGYTHKSDLDKKFATGEATQKNYIQTIDEQIAILKGKNCLCSV